MKEVTIIIAPGERYSGIANTLKSLYQCTHDPPFDMTFVDGALPESIRQAVEKDAYERGFRFIHKEYPLTPTEAKNIGASLSTTPYIVFCDNDVIFQPNWLSPLLNTAKELDAWLVGPTILDGNNECVHAAGGEQWFDEANGKRRYHFRPRYMQLPFAEVKHLLERGPTSMLEFHVLLVRRELFETIGPLDEGVMSFADHDHLVITAIEAGKPVIHEPASVVTYFDPQTNIDVLQPIDLPYYYLRWSDDWNFRSIERAAAKWQLDPGDPWITHAKRWIRLRRRRAYRIGGPLGRAVGFVLYKVSRPLGETLERAYCAYYTRRITSKRPRETHAPIEATALKARPKRNNVRGGLAPSHDDK